MCICLWHFIVLLLCMVYNETRLYTCTVIAREIGVTWYVQFNSGELETQVMELSFFAAYFYHIMIPSLN